MKVVFMGTPKAAAVSLLRLLNDGHDIIAVYTQPDRPSGRGHKIIYSPVKELALERGLTVLQPLKLKTSDAIKEFRAYNADIAVVVAYGRILPEPYLTGFPNGAVNVHFSLLPKYRGAAPVNWAIVNGETTTGVTTIKMDAGLDTGDVYLSEETHIGPEETAVELMERLSDIGANVLSRTLTEFDRLLPQPQDHSAATLAPIMKRGDGLINWLLSAKKISDRIRGFQPFPGTYTNFRGQKLSIHKASLSVVDESKPAGMIVAAHGDELTVVCGDNTALDIIELQPEGKRRMAVRDFINGSQPRVGEILGTTGI